MHTHPHMAEVIAADYAAIQAAGGNAAIDYKDGELALRCTMPGKDRRDWGHGAIPAPMGDAWVRIAQTTQHSAEKPDVAAALDSAADLLDQARKALHDALTAGTAVESLVVLPMVAQAAERRRNVQALASARNTTD